MLQKLKLLLKQPIIQKLALPRLRKLWALGLVCVLLALSVLVSAGGGRTPEPTPPSGTAEAPETAPTVPATEPPAPEEPAELQAVKGLEPLPGESVSGLCRDGDGAAVFLTRWDDEAQVWRIRMLRLDPRTAVVTEELALEPIGESASFAVPELNDTEIRFVDRDSERCAAFDRSGRFLGLKDHPVMSREHLGWRNVLLSDGCFYKQRAWAEFTRSDSGELNRAVAFYDEKSCVHLVGEAYDLIRDVDGHRLLTVRFCGDGSEELALLDLDAKRCVDRLALELGESADGLLGPDWALLSLTQVDEAATGYRICFWYPEAGQETPLETETLTEQALSDGVDVLRQRLEAQGLVLRLDEAPAVEQTPTTGLPVYESRCETGASLFGQYWILTELDAFVQKLPAGMIRELTAAPGQAPAEANGLQVFIVRNIPGDSSAFANAWMEPTMICFATEEFNPTHLAHEFMHIMDRRLQGYLTAQRQDLESAWRRLSPDYAYEPGLSQEQSDALEAYFVSWYARTDGAEDRAETFQRLFDSEEPLAEQWWYKDKPGVQEKVRWLSETLRAAFPSVQAVERACWEKLPPPAEAD